MKLAQWSDVGAIASAGTVAATIFCCLPFATGLIGAGVAAFGSRIAPFQPYLLYGADAKWDAEPTGLIHWGRTIVAGRETLRGDFQRLFTSR